MNRPVELADFVDVVGHGKRWGLGLMRVQNSWIRGGELWGQVLVVVGFGRELERDGEGLGCRRVLLTWGAGGSS